MPPSDLADVVARLRDARDAGAVVADEPLGKALLRAVGVASPESHVVATADEAASVAAKLDGPVALKIVARDLSHKSDVGGVAGPLEGSEAVRTAAREMLARLDGELLVEAWEAGGSHCFVGLSLRGPLGPVISVGLGGIWVEVLRDVAHRAAPVTAAEAAEALSALRGAPLLQGGRGHDAVDLDALCKAVARISALALDRELRDLVADIDVNPLLGRPARPPLALDCTVVLVPRTPDRPDAAHLAGVAS